MKLLLYTHTFIWWDSDPTQLSERVLDICRDSNNTLLLSIATVWEIQIKSQLGKLKLKLPLTDLIENQQRINGFQLLSIDLNHVLELEELPLHHKDPFDRLLIAQSKIEEAILLSKDSAFSAYSIQTIW